MSATFTLHFCFAFTHVTFIPHSQSHHPPQQQRTFKSRRTTHDFHNDFLTTTPPQLGWRDVQPCHTLGDTSPNNPSKSKHTPPTTPAAKSRTPSIPLLPPQATSHLPPSGFRVHRQQPGSTDRTSSHNPSHHNKAPTFRDHRRYSSCATART